MRKAFKAQPPSLSALSLMGLLALPLWGCGGGGSGSGDSSTTPTTPTTPATVPGAPSLGTVTAGNGSASLAFTAPSSTGGSAITDYLATCSLGASAFTATATSSPVVVSGLSNGSSYSCSVQARNAVGAGPASAAATVSPAAASAGASTAGVECAYSRSAFNSSPSVNAIASAAWNCTASTRVLTANGLPDHATGTFPNANNPNAIAAQSVSASFTLSPSYSGTATTLGGPRGPTGYVLNGVKIDANTAGTCPDGATSTGSCSLIGNTGAWSIEALGQSSFNFGPDANNAHVQPGGEYHYHGMPEGFITLRGGGPGKMTLVGWAADGFPIYARYGYSVAGDASSPLKVITGSYRLKSAVSANRPSPSLIPLGTFAQDWEYVAGLGDLDECNGRTGVTPEFPNGIYHYYATDSYPYFQRCVKGRT
ncbi:hypothetical protein HNQ51_002171 [Inhella inkyongensis]|uniref:Fibronectin type-III domain-containing protein n=1 Tax=Inhella inkyongensis TaxID=392593 RepID=A0A840S166_9BURK|nr:YHYH protein [Inhella inkyongensis]MBB5204857.1 hypothetical protein [Inhella inkyongensis]